MAKAKRAPVAVVEPTPNEWCPVAGLPAFMYAPVPSGPVDDGLLERHVLHWLETADFDEEQQVGFWAYNAYQRALPKESTYLANRIMNLELAFPDHYEEELRRTIRGILAVVEPDFDWEAYFARALGGQRIG